MIYTAIMDYFKVLSGAGLIIAAILLLYLTVESMPKSKKFDYMLFSFDVKIYGAVLMFIAIGAILIYRGTNPD